MSRPSSPCTNQDSSVTDPGNQLPMTNRNKKKYTNVYRLPTIKPIDGWFQYDYVLDLAEGTENNYTVIG